MAATTSPEAAETTPSHRVAGRDCAAPRSAAARPAALCLIGQLGMVRAASTLGISTGCRSAPAAAHT